MENFSFGIDFSPEFLEKYEILGTLGEGGMGQVYLGLQKSLGRKVAIKFLSGRVIMSERRIEKFNNEARLCADMRHPNIVELYDFGGGSSPKDRPYMVFELIDGESLADRIKREGALSIKDTLEIGINILEGLQYAHEKGITHRDIKSDNILLSKGGTVKVADFGIAVANQKDEDSFSGENISKKEKFIPGTPAYMSPEQAKNEEATHLSDIYSTGIILYEMLTGHVPFRGETSMAIIIQHISNSPENICSSNPQVPPQLEEVVMRALEKDPAARYQSAEEFMMKLKKAKTFVKRWRSTASLKIDGEDFQRKSRVLSGSLSLVRPETSEEKLKRRLGWAASGLAVCLVLASVLWFIFGPEAPKVKNLKVLSGFTEAVIQFETNVPAKGSIEYWSDDGPVKKYLIQKSAQKHSVRLTGLEEFTAYKFTIYLNGGEKSREERFDTKTVEFTNIHQTPIINGVELTWTTSIKTKTEARYVSSGEVKSRQVENKFTSNHCLRVSVHERMDNDEIQLVAVIDNDFEKIHVIRDFQTLDSSVIRHLTEMLKQLEDESNETDFNLGFQKRIREKRLQANIARFSRFKSEFFASDEVASMDKWRLYGRLMFLSDYQDWCSLVGNPFNTGISKLLDRRFMELSSNPLSRVRSRFACERPSSLEENPVRLTMPLKLLIPVDDSKPMPSGWLAQKLFYVPFPDGKNFRRGVIAIEHNGFTALGQIELTVDRLHLVLKGLEKENYRVLPGTLYHSFDAGIFRKKALKNRTMKIEMFPIRGLDMNIVDKVPDFDGFSVVINSISFYFDGD